MAKVKLDKAIYFPEMDAPNGVCATYFETDKTILLQGWFDTIVAIPGGRIGLADFLQKLGITEADCLAAFSPMKNREG